LVVCLPQVPQGCGWTIAGAVAGCSSASLQLLLHHVVTLLLHLAAMTAILLLCVPQLQKQVCPAATGLKLMQA
jgi:hypothetical protein